MEYIKQLINEIKNTSPDYPDSIKNNLDWKCKYYRIEYKKEFEKLKKETLKALRDYKKFLIPKKQKGYYCKYCANLLLTNTYYCNEDCKFNWFKQNFWKKVIKLKNCWEWKSCKGTNFYGHYYKMPAHRFSYLICVGKIPDGLIVCHKCDNPPCVNPDHLFLGTKKDNGRDMSIKGRSTRGNKNASCKLTEEDIYKIKNLQKQGYGRKRLSKLFPQVSSSQIARILRGENWGWLK